MRYAVSGAEALEARKYNKARYRDGMQFHAFRD